MSSPHMLMIGPTDYNGLNGHLTKIESKIQLTVYLK